ncbi:MAG: hypothetical protein AABW59_03375 [archaeon]
MVATRKKRIRNVQINHSAGGQLGIRKLAQGPDGKYAINAAKKDKLANKNIRK